MYANLRKGVSYYLACKLALISTMTIATILRLPVPYLPIHLVVMEAFMDVVGSSTFTVEPAEYDVMSAPPRDPSLQFLDRRLIRKIVISGAILFAATTGVYIWACIMNDDQIYARTMAFVSWMVGYLALAWVMRSDSTPLHVLGFSTNRLLPVWTILTIVTLILIMSIPTLRGIIRLEQLSPRDWIIAVLIPALAAPCLEVLKICRYAYRTTAISHC